MEWEGDARYSLRYALSIGFTGHESGYIALITNRGNKNTYLTVEASTVKQANGLGGFNYSVVCRLVGIALGPGNTRIRTVLSTMPGMAISDWGTADQADNAVIELGSWFHIWLETLDTGGITFGISSLTTPQEQKRTVNWATVQAFHDIPSAYNNPLDYGFAVDVWQRRAFMSEIFVRSMDPNEPRPIGEMGQLAQVV